MKTNELKPFQELKYTNKLLRLDWFGGVQGNLYEDDNPLIECIFTPYELPDPATGITTLKPQRAQQFIAGLATGYLPALFIGQCFCKGKRVLPNPLPPSETITFLLDVSAHSSITECTLASIPLAKTAEFISPRFKQTANRSGLKKLSGAMLKSSNKKINDKIKYRDKSLPEVVLIHELELVRFYLTNSSYSCKNILTGAFSAANLGGRVLNEIHETHSLDPVTGKGRFVYRHGYKEIDAASLGRILFTPNNLGLIAARRVYNSATAERINDDSSVMGYPRTLFPFIGKTKLILSGRRIKTDSGFIFLANRIHSCSASFPYKSLSYCDEITPGGAPPPDDAETAFSDLDTIDEGPAHEDDPTKTTGSNQSKQPPNAASKQLLIELRDREYLGLIGVLIYKEKLRDCTHKSKKKLHRYLDTMTDASTGRGIYGDSSTTRQSVTERIVIPFPLTPNLQIFMEAINKLPGLRPN